MSIVGGATATTVTNNANMYRVGDYVYFESNNSGPFTIRRIEELNKSANGNVEARVMCFYRRSEIPSSLVPLADKHHWGDVVEMDQDSDDEEAMEKENSEQNEKLKLKQREVFLSRQIETLPATLIRGKCSVTLMSEVETINSYTSRQDAFFYSLVFDPHQKTLQADRGNIRIGSEFQAKVPPVDGTQPVRDSGDLEELQWSPENELDQEKIDQFVIISRSVGTFARALDCSSSVKQPSLHMSAAAASRDITVLHAYQALHNHNYNIDAALSSLVPTSGPVLCRDELEDWSSAEANLFEEAIEKYGKDFNDIKKDFLPWKSMRNIIEYFFMWKTTDRYVQQKRIKAIESENKLKQVYVPAYTRKSQRVIGPNGEVMILGKDCDAYPDMTKYSWSCYKKYGKFSAATNTDDCFIIDKSISSAARLIQNRPGLIIEPGSPVKVGKTRAAFFLRTTPLTRAARRASKTKLTHFARKPNKLIDMKTIRAEVLPTLSNKEAVMVLNRFSPKTRSPIVDITLRMGQPVTIVPDWVVVDNKHTPPEKEAFPKPEKRSDGSYIYERIPSVGGENVNSNRQQMLYKKRAYDERPPEPPVPSKVGKQQPKGRGYSVNQVTPKGARKIAAMTRIAGGQKTVISWQDAPDDLFFRASPAAKKTRKQLTSAAIRRCARRPFRRIM